MTTANSRPEGSPKLPPQGLAGRLWGRAYLLLTLTTLAWGGNAVAGRLRRPRV